MVRVDRINIEKLRDEELSNERTARAKSVQDYNIMIGNLEDPEEDEEDE